MGRRRRGPGHGIIGSVMTMVFPQVGDPLGGLADTFRGVVDAILQAARGAAVGEMDRHVSVLVARLDHGIATFESFYSNRTTGGGKLTSASAQAGVSAGLPRMLREHVATIDAAMQAVPAIRSGIEEVLEVTAPFSPPTRAELAERYATWSTWANRIVDLTEDYVDTADAIEAMAGSPTLIGHAAARKAAGL